MEHIAAILLIVGCADDLQQCHELPAPAPMFETARECEEILESSMRDFMGQYPQVMARCVAVDPAKEYVDAQLVWDITPKGDLTASLETANDYRVASTVPEATVAQ